MVQEDKCLRIIYNVSLPGCKGDELLCRNLFNLMILKEKKILLITRSLGEEYIHKDLNQARAQKCLTPGDEVHRQKKSTD